MVDINTLLKTAEAFHFRAVYAQQAQAAQYASFVVRKMQALVSPALASINHLLSIPQYQRSAGLQALKSQLPAVAQKLSSFTSSSGEDFYTELGNMISGLSFFTSGNVGTGHDPATTAAVGGYTPPSYYVSALTNLFERIKPKEAPVTPSSDTLGPQVQTQIQNQNIRG